MFSRETARLTVLKLNNYVKKLVQPIIQIGDKRLLTKSKEISIDEIDSKENQELYQDLFDTAKQKGLNSVGLSAVQIGVLKRVFVAKINLKDKKKSRAEWHLFINPTVTYNSTDTSTMWEGCLSVGTGKKQLFGPVSRPNEITLEYFDSEGKRKSLTTHAYGSHLIQHEMDHLNGVLFLTYINDPRNIWQSGELDKYLSKYGEYPDYN